MFFSPFLTFVHSVIIQESWITFWSAIKILKPVTAWLVVFFYSSILMSLLWIIFSSTCFCDSRRDNITFTFTILNPRAFYVQTRQ